MSADNFYRICRHPKGGFTAVMGFMSNREDGVEPQPKDSDPQFDTWQEAYAHAESDWIIEYGIEVDRDIMQMERPSANVDDLKRRLKAFGADCVHHGDMTPMAQRMLERILDGQP